VVEEIVRRVITRIGYTTPDTGFDLKNARIESVLSRQSGDIALGVDHGLEGKLGEIQDDLDAGAGDQGMMFGYACDESPELMPLPIALAHRLTRRLAQVRKDGTLPWLRPDGKSQVTVEYRFGQPARVDAVVISTQHAPDVDNEQIERDVRKHVIEPVIERHLLDEETKYFINPTGRFVVGGPFGDSGLTGRKIIVDTYGGMARHGGGAFSGKDPSKVDRSAAYAARWVAKNVVAAGLAKRCEVNLAYAIGVARPVSVAVETFGTESVPVEQIERAITETFDLRPAGIIKALDLRRPIFEQTAAYGHFGRTDLDVPWESTDKAERLKAAVGSYAAASR
jgi:S-adenosylmethionine synthetase